MKDKAEVEYRETGSKIRNCGTCSMFRAPHGCTAVEGHIRPQDVCNLWTQKR